MKHHRIPSESKYATYYKHDWLVLEDGGSGSYRYVCRDGLTYFFIELIDMVEYCGSDATERWCCDVAVVDLLTVTPDTLASAIQSCGWGDGTDEDFFSFKTESGRLALADCLYSYGAKAPMSSESAGKVDDEDHWHGNGHSDTDPVFRKLRADARRYVEAELFDEESRNDALDTRIVNKLGQTAREYAGGTDALWNTLRRIQAAGDDATPEQQLVLKMYQGAGQTLGAGPVPEDIREG